MDTQISSDELLGPLPIMGTCVTPFHSSAHAVECISRRIAERKRTFCVAINGAKLYYARRHPAVATALRAADFWLCDGICAVLAAWLLQGRRVRRCTDGFLESLLAKSEANRWKVFLLGASQESNQGAVGYLRENYPALQIAGSRDGYFDNATDILGVINQSGADILVIGMGTPRQELWVAEHLPLLSPLCIVTVGGALDVLSGTARRAPNIFRKTGTEFVYRLLSEPSKKRWRRLCQVCIAGTDVLAEYVRLRLSRRHRTDNENKRSVSFH